MTGGRVICIGETGRNFAAGMSGGFAYVLDTKGNFRSRCNMGMVELEELSAEDAQFVAHTLEEHVLHTGSEQASALLADWETTLSNFIKVVPVEYRRVMAQIAAAEPQVSARRDSLSVIRPLGGHAPS
jgi:glutamate synthase domain-containing protein 3